MIPIRNIYYMLAYAFQDMSQSADQQWAQTM